MCKPLHSSEEYFNIESITYNAGDNWALCLTNLKKLHRGLILYLEDELNLPHEHISGTLDLGQIARRGSENDILKLIQLVLLTVLNCHNKEVYIHKIMELEEAVQTQLMFFIEQVIESAPKIDENPEENRKKYEVRELRKAKRALTTRVNNLENMMQEMQKEKEQLLSARNEILMTNTELQFELAKKAPNSAPRKLSSSSMLMDMEQRLADKELEVNLLNKKLSDLQKSSKEEITRLQDELDVEHEKVIQLTAAEQTLQMYKKRLEQSEEIKKLYQESEMEVKSLRENMQKMEEQVLEVSKVKKLFSQMQQELKTSREREESLVYTLETREDQIKQRNKQINQLKLRIKEYETTDVVTDMDHMGDISSLKSEDDSFKSNSKQFLELHELNDIFDKDQPGKPRPFDDFPGGWEEMTNNPLHKILNNIQMMREDWQADAMRYQERLNSANNQIELLTAQVEVHRDEIEQLGHMKIRNSTAVYEMEALRKERDSLNTELMNVYQEKDEITARFIEARDLMQKSMLEKNKISLQLKEKEHDIHRLQQKVIEMQEQETLSLQEIQRLKGTIEGGESIDKIFEAERQIISLQNEIEELKAQHKRYQADYEEQINSKNRQILWLTEDHQRQIESLNHEYNRQVREIENNTEQAISRLQFEKDEIASRLHWNKQNNITDLKQAVERVSSNVHLHQDVKKYQAEIVKLNQMNQILRSSLSEMRKINRKNEKFIRYIAEVVGVTTRDFVNAVKSTQQFFIIKWPGLKIYDWTFCMRLVRFLGQVLGIRCRLGIKMRIIYCIRWEGILE